MSDDAVSITAEFLCKIAVSANFPSFDFAKERLYFQWSTEFTKGESIEAKIDSKGTTSDDRLLHSFLFLQLSHLLGDVKWQLKIDTTTDGTDETLESLCTLKFFKVR
jgi:hypothetical protein